MLIELSVKNLGVIAEVGLVFGPGMTALTGETGAGKTLIVDAIQLLVGGRADPVLVGPHGPEAVVEGRFVIDTAEPENENEHEPKNEYEIVLRRVIPAQGRSRAYIDGRLATASELAEWGARLVDLHGQHAHQSLLAPAMQRDLLDRFGSVDLTDLIAAQRRVAEIETELASLGGDERARAREIDLYRFQVAELDAAALTDPDEDAALDAEEDLLADALSHQQAGAAASELLTGDGGAADLVGQAIAAVADRSPFAAHEARLRAVAAELADISAEVRDSAEVIEQDPSRLNEVRQRRQLLHELRRKYGETLAAVIEYADEARNRLAELEGHDAKAAALDDERKQALVQLEAAQAKVGAARRRVAPKLGRAVVERLQELAMPRAEVVVSVGDADPGDDVEFRLAANPGSPPLPLAKTASGGELARTMLAIRLVLTSGPPVLVFDEVDAGIGGEAAVAVGQALAAIGQEHQVLVVTHLPQVAAWADHQLAVVKRVEGDLTHSEVRSLEHDERVEELARMLSGQAGGDTARSHAAELLSAAGQVQP